MPTPPRNALTVSRSHGDRTVVLALAGELDTSTSPVLAFHIAGILNDVPAPVAVILDLTEVRFLSVNGVRAIRAVNEHTSRIAVRLRIVTDPSSVATAVLVTTGAARVLDCYSGRAAALAAPSAEDFERAIAAAWEAPWPMRED